MLTKRKRSFAGFIFLSLLLVGFLRSSLSCPKSSAGTPDSGSTCRSSRVRYATS